MRIIPVMDLQNGLTVHAVKGDRANYRPVTSVLCSSADPLKIARAFRDSLGARELYIADLDSIQNNERRIHHKILDALVQEGNMEILLDAGVSDIVTINAWLEAGIHKIIVGSETLHSCNAINEISSVIDPGRLIFSLDSRNGALLTQCPVLEQMSAHEIMAYLQGAGWQEVILLDLARAGSNRGAERTSFASVRNEFPDLTLLTGGGITGPAELDVLASLGADGVLVATALHNGVLQAEHFQKYRNSRNQ